MALADQFSTDASQQDVAATQYPTYGTPSKLLDNLMQTESSGNPNAVNKKTGATGAYQFLPSTIEALKKDGLNFDPTDAAQSRAAADYYISKLAAQNGGDYRKAMAAYGGFVTQDPTSYVNKVTAGLTPEELKQQPMTAPKPVGEPVAATPGKLASQFTQDATNTLKPTPEKTAASQPTGAPSLAAQTAQNVFNVVSPLTMGKTLGENALQMGTGAIASAGGGLRGLYDLATGRGVDKAAQDIQSVQQNYTYQPRSQAGKQLSEGISAATGKANQLLGQGAASSVAALGGSPKAQAAAQSIGEAAIPVASTLAGGYGALKAASGLNLGSIGPSLEDLQSLGNAAPKTPEPSPTAAPSAASPLDSLKQQISQQNPKLSDTQIQRHAEAASLPIKAALTDAQASGDPIAISNELNSRATQPHTVAILNSQNQNLIDNLNVIRQKVAPNIVGNTTDIGQQLVDSYKGMDDAATDKIRANYQAVADQNAGKMPLDVPTFLQNVNTTLADKKLTRFVPSNVRGMLDDIQKSGTLTVDDYMDYDKLFGQQQRAAARSADGASAENAVGVIRTELNKMPTNQPMTSDVAQLYRTARASAKARFDAIKADPAYAAVVDEDVPRGSPSPLADNFTQKYISGQGARTANVGNMMTNLKDDPLAQQAIRAATVDSLKASAGINLLSDTGNVSQAGLNKAIQGLGNKNKLLFGDDADTLNTLGNVARYQQEQPKGSYVNNSNTGVMLAKDIATLAAKAMFPRTMMGVEAAGGVASKMKNQRYNPSSVNLNDLK